MSYTIWKYAYDVNDEIFVPTPDGSMLLDVQEQYGKLTFWFLVDDEGPMNGITYHVYGTGHQVQNSTGKYVATVQQMGGHLVWHIFEKVPT